MVFAATASKRGALADMDKAAIDVAKALARLSELAIFELRGAAESPLQIEDRGADRGLLTTDFWEQKTPKPRYRFLNQMMFQRSEGTMERRPLYV
jgi:hypothetical protein